MDFSLAFKDDRVEQCLRSRGSEFQMWGPKHGAEILWDRQQQGAEFSWQGDELGLCPRGPCAPWRKNSVGPPTTRCMVRWVLVWAMCTMA